MMTPRKEEKVEGAIVVIWDRQVRRRGVFAGRPWMEIEDRAVGDVGWRRRWACLLGL